MATEKQVAANRRNAQKSTGPRTPAGKARSSLNNLRHGLRAGTLILPDEDPAEFDALHDGIQAYYNPRNPPEQRLVDEMARAEWKLLRAEILEADLYYEDLTPSARVIHTARLNQMQSRLKRQWTLAYRELERIRTERAQPPAKTAKPDKQSKNEPPPDKLEVSWVNPRTGEKQVIARMVNGKNVDEFPPDPDPKT